MSGYDEIEIEVLDDGTIKSITDPISPSNHSNADQLFRLMEELSGTKSVRQRKNKTHVHVHQHGEIKAK